MRLMHPWTMPCLLFAAACDNGVGGSLACPAIAEPAVVVWLTDALTGDPVRGATATLREGSYIETMSEVDGAYRGGLERPGTYDLLVTAAGYVDETRTGIAAAALPCGPNTQELAIAMQPLGVPATLIVGSDHAVDLLPVWVLPPSGR